MPEEKFNCDHLRPAEFLYEPDPRTHAFVRRDLQAGGFRPLVPEDYYEAVSQYQLHGYVPEQIVVQFETAKNIYLYAWFIHRFYPVVYLQAFACLELALRTVYEEDIPKEYYKRTEKPMLRGLLKFAIDKGDVTNAGFEEWFRGVEGAAYWNFQIALSEKMDEQDISSVSWSDNDVKVEDHDLMLDYVGQLLDEIPDTRNHYAHGTTELHNQSLRSIKIVSEIINQIY